MSALREIAGDLLRPIDAGEWGVGETLAPMRKLAEHYGASRNAVGKLAKDGRLV